MKTYTVEITTALVTYTEDGIREELETPTVTTHTWERDDDCPPDRWAVARIRRTDAAEPSQYPLGDKAGPRVWLSGTYLDPYDNHLVTETTVRLIGGWTPAERAQIFTRALTT